MLFCLPKSKFLTVTDLSERWNISRAHAYRVVGTTLPALRVGNAVRVLLSDVEAFERRQLGKTA